MEPIKPGTLVRDADGYAAYRGDPWGAKKGPGNEPGQGHADG